VSKLILSIRVYDGEYYKNYKTANTAKSFTRDFFKKEKDGVYHLKLAVYLSKEFGGMM